jgi:serine/threonine protein kinase
LNELGDVRIGDLGYSKSMSIISTKSSKYPGTINYMSPEIVNQQKDYTYKIDIWSLGCVIYELITLEKLFNDTNELNIKLKILNQEIILPETDSILKGILNG